MIVSIHIDKDVDKDVRAFDGVEAMAADQETDEEIRDLLPAAIDQDRRAVNRLI